MSNKNSMGIEGNALNLSLSGSQVSNRNVPNRSARKPPAFLNRPSSARSNSNYMDPLKQKDTNSPLNSGRANGTTSTTYSNNKARNMPPMYQSKQQHRAEEQQKLTNESISQSNNFTPLSVRSSTDSIDYNPKFSKPAPVSYDNPLDLFFGKDDSSNANETQDYEVKSRISNLDAMEPVKDEKISKLQSSCDNLRRELQQATEQEASLKQKWQRVENTKRKMSALKIQAWYRRKQNERSNQLSEMQKLFSQKRVEMKKKIASENEQDKVSAYNNRRRQLASASMTRESKTSVANKMLASKSASKIVSPRSPAVDVSTASSIHTLINESSDSAAISTSERKDVNKTTTSDEKNTTVESLLLSLDKIEKESTELLKVQSENANKSTKLNDTASSVGGNGRVNSILDYLNDVTVNDSANTFVPKPFKDLTIDLTDYSDYQEKSSASDKPKTTTSNRPSSASRVGARNQKWDSSKQVSSNSQASHRENGLDSARALTKKSAQKTTQQSIAGKSEKENRQSTKPKPVLEKRVSVEELEDTISREIELQDEIQALKLSLAEKTRSSAMLEKALNQQKELTLRHTHEADNEMQLRLQAQKNDYEATIQRHLSFIDQLIDDKKSLSEKCEKMIKQLTDVEKTYSEKFKTADSKYNFEMQKLKDTFEAAEKIRRERWIEEKTKKIKEMTVKGLEPEIQSLITRHKNEIKTLKAVHEAELLQADERASQRYIKITEELRENYEREKESGVQREREVCKQRYEKSLEEEEKSFLEQRRRLYKEIEEEKERIAEQGAFQRKELDRLRRTLEENNLSTIETIKKEYAQVHAEQEKKHADEVRNLTEKLEIEKQSWEENHLKKQGNWAQQTEREIREKLKRERDKEIELIIGKLEAESTLNREECERTADNRIKRIRDKYESELKEVEATERDTMERFNTLKAKYNELEGEYEHLKVVFNQKEKEMAGIKKLTDVLQDERNRLADVIRQDFSDRLIFTEEENKRIKLEMVEMRSRHQCDLDKKKAEFEKLERDKAEELDTVHEKIKQVLAKKDETANQLRTQYEAACKRADHLEGLLEQQRTLMLKKQSHN